MKRKGVNLEPQVDPNGLLYKGIQDHFAYRVLSLGLKYDAELGYYIEDGCRNVITAGFNSLIIDDIRQKLHPYTAQSGILVVRIAVDGKTEIDTVINRLRTLKLELNQTSNVVSFGLRNKYVFIPLSATAVEKFYALPGVKQSVTTRANFFKRAVV